MKSKSLMKPLINFHRGNIKYFIESLWSEVSKHGLGLVGPGLSLGLKTIFAVSVLVSRVPVSVSRVPFSVSVSWVVV